MSARQKLTTILLALLAAGCVRYVPTDQWVGTWATAPQAAMPGTLQKFRDQQLRLIVHTTLGGRKVRLRISNAYGHAPLTIGAARIARRLRESAIDVAGERSITFGDQRSVTIAAGDTLTSDGVDFEVPPFSDIAVTLFLPGASSADTSHLLALQTSYLSAPGVAPDAPFSTAGTLDSWPFLTGVDVLPDGTAAAIVVLGDSTVDGDGSTKDSNHRYPDMLARQLARPAAPIHYSVLNLGLIGNRLLRDSPGQGSEFGDALGPAGVTRFERDALALPGVTCVVLRIGINDIGFPGSFAPQADAVGSREIIDGYRRLTTAAHARGVRLVAVTLTPFNGTAIIDGFYTPEKERVRREVNAWLRRSKELDSVIDLDDALRDPADATRLAAPNDSGDHLHSGDAGNERAAAATPPDICTAPPRSTG